jgi:hypothetical protein
VSLRGDNRFSHKDANHDTIVLRYQALYCSVVDLHTLGLGCPDILVGCAGRSELVEIKDEDEEGTLNASQQRFVRDWRGNKVIIVRNYDDVSKHVKRMRER